MKLEKQIAVVTGGNSGIGRASAEVFAREGATVVIFGRDQEKLDATLESLGDGHRAVRGDVSKLADIDRLFAEVEEHFGRIDVLHANAGVAPTRPVAEVDEEHFDKLFDINVKGLYFTVQKAIPLLSDGASVILTGSSVSYRGMPGMSVYGATKAAVRYLSRGFATELVDRGIRINTLSPGPIETPLFDRMGLEDDEKEQMADQITQSVPMGRFGKPEEMAAAALFLASSDSSYMTGNDLLADGGFATM